MTSEQVRVFFIKNNILDEQEVDTFFSLNYVDIDISMSNHNLPIINIESLVNDKGIVNEITPFEIFKKVYEWSKKNEKYIKVIFKSNFFDSNQKVLSQYISYFFLNRQDCQNNIVNSLLSSEAYSVMESGTLIIKYVSDIEKKFVHERESDLKIWMNSIGFKVTHFDYVINKDLRDVNLGQKEILEQASIPIVDDHKAYLRRMENLNKIEQGTFIKLSEELIEYEHYFVKGKIFKIDIKSIKKLNLDKFTFSISDFNGVLRVTSFYTPKIKEKNSYNNFVLKKKRLDPQYLHSFVVGDWVSLEVEIFKNEYENDELMGGIIRICKTNDQVDDLIEDVKKPRIELLTRTKMSAFDGLISPEELIHFANHLNWSVIGVADRFNVHVFPKICDLCEKNNKKIIYGTEINVLEDEISIVINENDCDLRDFEYVVFDIETTGLQNEYDEIIEFGAVKLKNDIVLEKINFLIKPKKELSKKIIELTNITQEMLDKDGITLKSALKKIVDFFSDCVLVAHNGINFDLSFINKKLLQNDLSILTNPLIDTMQLSRAINEDLKKHNLNALCSRYKQKYVEAHRAINDALMLSKVFSSMLSQLINDKKIINLKQINANLQNNNLKSKQFGYTCLVYMLNQHSVKKMYDLVSLSLTQNLYGRPRIFKKYLNDIRVNFLVVNSPIDGDVFDIAINGSDEQLEKCVQYYDYIFICPPNSYLHLVSSGDISIANIKQTIKKIIKTSIKLNKTIIAVSDAYYLSKSYKKFRDILIGTKQLNGLPHRLFDRDNPFAQNPDAHIRLTNEMLKEFDFLDDKHLIEDIVINNAYEFNDKIDDGIQILQHGMQTPKVDNANTLLIELVNKTKNELYGNEIHPLVEERFNKEMDMIVKNNYQVIYWIAHKLVEISKKDNVYVGSRGSVGSSFIAFLAKITEVNPLPPHYLCPKCKYFEISDEKDDGFDLIEKKCPRCNTKLKTDGHNIPFETFLGFENDSKYPDIDLNFPSDYQLVAHNHVREMFGKNHVIRVGTITTLAEKNAFNVVREYCETFNIEMSNNMMNWIGKNLEGIKRTTGQHAGGLIILPREKSITDFFPYNFPSDKIFDDNGNKQEFVTHFDIEEFKDNFLKLDVLGHDDEVLMKKLEIMTNTKLQDIPFYDENVLKSFTSVEPLKFKEEFLSVEILKLMRGSLTLPEFGTMVCEKKTSVCKPTSFADLVCISGLSHGTGVWEQNAQELIVNEHLSLSDVITYRDVIMLYLIKKGVDTKTAFYVMESVRKGKGIKEEYEEILKQKNVPTWYINSCKKIKYLFPKAHAVAYVMNAWKSAWYKVYYPLQYYATYFSTRATVFDLSSIPNGIKKIYEAKINLKEKAILSRFNKPILKKRDEDLMDVYDASIEVYARGFHIKNIDINLSDAIDFKVIGSGLLPPFISVDGLGEVVAKTIVNARNEKSFSSIDDLMNRTKINSKILQIMRDLGILNGLREHEEDKTSLFSRFAY